LCRRERFEGWKCFRVMSFREATGRVVAETAKLDAVRHARSITGWKVVSRAFATDGAL
jgi:hypothetical protein